MKAALRRATPPPRPRRLGLLAGLFCVLAGPFVFVPWGVTEYREIFSGRIERLNRYMAAESEGVMTVRDGLAVAGGKPFLLVLRLAKVRGQGGELRLHNAQMPGLTNRLTLRDPDNPKLAPIRLDNYFADLSRPISLDPLRPARVVEVRYEASYDGPGAVLVLHGLQFAVNWTEPVWPYLAAALGLAALAWLLGALTAARSGHLVAACAALSLVQISWWRLGWPHGWFFLAGAAIVLLVGAIWRGKRSAESGMGVSPMIDSATTCLPRFQSWARRPCHTRRLALVAFLLLSALYAGLNLAAARAVPAPVICGDDFLYKEVASYPLSSQKFWVWHRPWTVPLVHKLAGRAYPGVVRWQVAVGLLAHLVLAWFFFRLLGGGVMGLIAALGVYLYALATCVEGWAMVIRSESVAFSLTALFLALLIVVLWQLLRSRPAPWQLYLSAGLFLLGAVLFVFTRDNWAWQLPPTALLLAVVSFTGRSCGRRRMQAWTGLALAALLVGLFAIQVRTARLGDRSQPCLMNVLFQRVFTDPDARRLWSERYKMPWDDTLKGLAGKWCFSNQYAGYKHKAFQDWLGERGVRSYVHYVLTHPSLSADAVWRCFRDIVNYFAMTEYLKEAGGGTRATRLSQRLVFFPLPPALAELALILCIVLPLGVALLTNHPGTAACGWGIFSLAAGLPLQMAICHLGDAMEVMRHCLAVSITLRLAMAATLTLLLAGLAREAGCWRRIWRQGTRRRSRKNI